MNITKEIGDYFEEKAINILEKEGFEILNFYGNNGVFNYYEIGDDEIRIINVVKAVQDIKSIDKAVSYIINDYANSQSYAKFIKEKRGTKK